MKKWWALSLRAWKKFEITAFWWLPTISRPISTKTHSTDPTLFAWAGKEELAKRKAGIEFTERFARNSGLHFKKGYELMPAFLGQSNGCLRIP